MKGLIATPRASGGGHRRNGTGSLLFLRANDGVVLRFDNVAMTNGSFNYPVPQDADVSAYNSVVVWCRQFSVLVTWADLR